VKFSQQIGAEKWEKVNNNNNNNNKDEKILRHKDLLIEIHACGM
jgi:hypothetical protein